MKKVGSLYSFLAASTLYVSPLALAAEQQSLEKKVASDIIPEIQEGYIIDSYSRLLANNVKKIKQHLEEAREKKINLSKEYDANSSEELLRTSLILETRSLAWYSIEALRGSEYEEAFTEPILAALHTTEETFGNHICRYPLKGRQKIITQLLAGREPLLGKDIEPIYHKNFKGITESVRFKTKGKGYIIPQHYQKLLGETIESWEHWSNNYTRLDEISHKRQDAVPPEYREEHQRRVLR